MSDSMFPRNINYEELMKIQEMVFQLSKDLEKQQQYIEKIPDNVHQSVEESCGKKVVPDVNEFTHDEITSMYYHIQTSMNDEYKKQAKKIEQIMDDKFRKAISAQHKMLVDTVNDMTQRQEKRLANINKMLLINTAISSVAAILSLLGIILTRI